MRVARLHLLAGVVLLTECGSQQDLVIGVSALAEAGSSSGSGGDGVGGSAAGTPAMAGAGGSMDAMAGAAGQAAGGDSSGAAGAGDAGAPTEPENCLRDEAPPIGSLIHLYSFNDASGTAAVDAISAADGVIKGTTLSGTGQLALTANGQYVDLPNDIMSTLTEVTVVAWTTWKGVPAWQRVFDFGASSGGEDVRNGGKAYFCMMSKTGFFNQTKPGLGGEIKAPGFDTVTLASTEDMTNVKAQVAFSFKGGERASIYLNGTRLATQATKIKVSDVLGPNNWIGRSQYDANTDYQGVFDEVRIYSVALNGCQLSTILVDGPQKSP